MKVYYTLVFTHRRESRTMRQICPRRTRWLPSHQFYTLRPHIEALLPVLGASSTSCPTSLSGLHSGGVSHTATCTLWFHGLGTACLIDYPMRRRHFLRSGYGQMPPRLQFRHSCSGEFAASWQSYSDSMLIIAAREAKWGNHLNRGWKANRSE
jgi:hypothetical protein